MTTQEINQPRAFHILSNSDDGYSYINRFEVKSIDGKLSYVASGSDSRVGATYWEEKMARSIVAFLNAYNPERTVELIEAI